MRLFLFFTFFLPSLSIGQAISEMRSWSDVNNKAIQAELLKFPYDFETRGLIRLRMKGGSTYTLSPQSLSAADQTEILKAWVSHYLRRFYDPKTEIYQVYTKKLSERSIDSKSTAYFGYNKEKVWLTLQIAAPKTIIANGDHLLMVNTDDKLVRIKYSADDVSSRRKNDIIKVNITGQIKALETIWQTADQTNIYIGDSGDNYSPVELSQSEKKGISEIINAFSLLGSPPKHNLWWAAVRGIKPSTVQEKVTEEIAKKEPSPPITDSSDWILNDDSTIHGKIKSFQGHQIELEIPVANSKPVVKLYEISAFSETSRQQIAKLRMSHSLKAGWHPYDEQFTWFWPNKRPTNQQTERNYLLFTINRATGEPHLYLQVKHDNATGESIKSCKLSGTKISLDMELSRNEASLQLRNPTSTIFWHRLTPTEANILLAASPVLDELNYTITTESDESIQSTMSEDDFKSSIEALEIYRAWKSLLVEK